MGGSVDLIYIYSLFDLQQYSFPELWPQMYRELLGPWVLEEQASLYGAVGVITPWPPQ